MRSVIAEGFVIGLLASIVGLIAGYGIYKGLNALFLALDVDLPKAGTVVSSRTIILSLVLGTVVTVAASILPALRATRVPPIAAVREGAELPPSRLAHHSTKAAGVLIAVAIAAIAVGAFASGLAGPSRDMLVKKSTPENSTGRVYGVVYSGLDIGQAVSPLVFGALMDHRNYQGVWLGLVIMQAVLIASAFNVRKVRRTALVAA